MQNDPKRQKPPSMQEILRIAQSPEGQKLIAILKNQNDPKLHQAMAQAAKGDYTQAKEMLSSLLTSDEIQKLLSKLGG